MNSQKKDELLRPLCEEQRKLNEQSNILRDKLTLVEKDLASISQAIDAIKGNSSRVKGIGSKGNRKRSSKPAPNKQEVATHLKAVASSGESLSELELKKRVGERLEKAGFSQMGVALRLKELLKVGGQ